MKYSFCFFSLSLACGTQAQNMPAADANNATAAAAMLTDAAPNVAPYVFESDATPYGLTYGEWAAQWWQWALAIPLAQNPIADTTGEFCNVAQHGEVFFLAGTFGGAAVTRACTIPAGKALFFPILNDDYVHAPGDSGTLDAQRAAIADALQGAELSLEIDGKSIESLDAFLEKSVRFPVYFPDGNIYGAPSGHYSPTVDSGYYVAVGPLSRGSHTLHLKGIAPTAGVTTEVTYNLTVR